MKNITIIGAGLAGAMMAIFLARRDYHVTIYEARSDLRDSNIKSGRSINLALSCRGITCLKQAGLYEDVQKILVPMRARAIHDEDGDIQFQPFGRHENEYINAVMRSELNELLLNHIERFDNIEVHFELELKHIDFENQVIRFKKGKKQEVTTGFDFIIGADGASSKVRDILAQQDHLQFEREFLTYGYKELAISEKHGGTLKREHLHLWPRESFMLLGNPNKDDSITGSLFIPHEGVNSLAHLSSERDVLHFFNHFFPDVIHCMPSLISDFFDHPTGNMSTINCSNWHYQDKCLLIGDAAHGIIPFFGQGMNCAFEDCRILDGLIEKHQDEWTAILPAFFNERKQNTEAVAEMSMDNYREIQHHIRDPKFNLKKQVEKKLMFHFPNDYISKHVLVMFSNVPYQTAYEIGEIQKTFIDEICKDIQVLEDIDWHVVDTMMKEYDKKMADFSVNL